MITEVELIEQMTIVLLEINEEDFLEICNEYLETNYTYNDVVWRDDSNE